MFPACLLAVYTFANQEADFMKHHNIARCMHGLSLFTWSKEMETGAEKCSNKHAKMAHDCERKGMGPGGKGMVGENLAGGGGTVGAAQSVKMWYEGELPNLGSCTMSNFQSCGHVSQVLWKTSKQIGCNAGKRTVCWYHPAGNSGDLQKGSGDPTPVKTREECEKEVASGSSEPSGGDPSPSSGDSSPSSGDSSPSGADSSPSSGDSSPSGGEPTSNDGKPPSSSSSAGGPNISNAGGSGLSVIAIIGIVICVLTVMMACVAGFMYSRMGSGANAAGREKSEPAKAPAKASKRSRGTPAKKSQRHASSRKHSGRKPSRKK